MRFFTSIRFALNDRQLFNAFRKFGLGESTASSKPEPQALDATSCRSERNKEPLGFSRIKIIINH